MSKLYLLYSILTGIPLDGATCVKSVFIMFRVDKRVQVECQPDLCKAGGRLSLLPKRSLKGEYFTHF